VSHTRPLEELRRGDAPRFGGKSASLGELIASEIPVPGGFALAAEAMGTDVRAEVTERYAALGGDDPPVAVRSSALGEDSAEASFAGLHETILWVRGADAVWDAVQRCWASLHSAEAQSYATAKAGGMGVAVQRMVDAEVSGVMFTCNPVSGDPSTVAVNASWGLGTAVVGGEVTPDEYRISKVTGEVLLHRIADKHVEHLEGDVAAEVPAERRNVACLGDERLGELLELGRRVEAHFGGHQDVEWAIARDGGGLFLLQSRPVTTRRERAPEKRSAMELVMKTFGA
jgi:pyruvate,water dikinase